MAATYDGDGNRTTQSSLYNRDRQLDAESDGLDGVFDIDLDSALDKGSVLRSGISAFLLGITAQATAFMSSVNPATIPWALDVMLGMLIDSVPASEGAPHGIPSLVMDLPAITGKERDAIASALGLIPKGLTSTEEVFDVVAYVNSTLTDNAQVMASVSTRSGTANETYGITRLATNTNGSATYFLNDGRGSVTQTVSQQGNPTSWRSYSAFGDIEASSNLGDLPSYGYNAEEQHPRTGLTYMRFRYYEAKTSTFGVQDTYLGNIFSPLTLNRYLYCLANPVNYTDPSGHVSVGRLTNIGRIAKNITTKINVLIAKAVTDLFVKIGDKRNAVKFDKKLRKAEEARKQYYKFYCGDAQKIGSYVYNRAAAIRYAQIFSNDTTHSTDTTLDYYYSLMSFGYRNPLFPTSYPGNCANFTSQALFFGGIPMTKDWHMLPTPAVVVAFLSMQGTPFDSSYRNVYHLWDRTANWTAASNQYEYFSNPDNGYINGDVINITLPNKPALNGAIEVPYSDLNDQLSSLNIRPGDLLYFYNEEGVHHSTMVSKVENGAIYYTANTTARFDENLKTAVDEESEYGFLVIRINDTGEIKK